jgi:hypothetical protein
MPFARALLAFTICVSAYLMGAQSVLAHAGHAHHAAPAAVHHTTTQNKATRDPVRFETPASLSAGEERRSPAAVGACGAQYCACFSFCHSAVSLQAASFRGLDGAGRTPLELSSLSFRPFGQADRHDPPPRSFI